MINSRNFRVRSKLSFHLWYQPIIRYFIYILLCFIVTAIGEHICSLVIPQYSELYCGNTIHGTIQALVQYALNF